MYKVFQLLHWFVQKLFKDSQVAPWIFDTAQVLEKTIDLGLRLPFCCASDQPRFKAIGIILHICQQVDTVVRGITYQVCGVNFEKIGQ